MKLRTVLPALLLSLLTAACATGPGEADDVESASAAVVSCDDADPILVDLETVFLEPTGATRKPPRAPLDRGDTPHKEPGSAADFATQADPGLDVDAACACTDDRCLIDWIGDSLGCGVCAHVACDDGADRGGCLPCESVDEPVAESCVFSDAPVVGALE